MFRTASTLILTPLSGHRTVSTPFGELGDSGGKNTDQSTDPTTITTDQTTKPRPSSEKPRTPRPTTETPRPEKNTKTVSVVLGSGMQVGRQCPDQRRHDVAQTRKVSGVRPIKLLTLPSESVDDKLGSIINVMRVVLLWLSLWSGESFCFLMAWYLAVKDFLGLRVRHFVARGHLDKVR